MIHIKNTKQIKVFFTSMVDVCTAADKLMLFVPVTPE